MGFMLANIDGRGALVDGEHYFDVATISDETLPSDPMLVLAYPVELTPAGIGAVQGKFLANGDVITTTIDGVGTLVNRCVRVSDHTSPGDSIGGES